jgi:protein disulfide-isomerase
MPSRVPSLALALTLLAVLAGCRSSGPAPRAGGSAAAAPTAEGAGTVFAARDVPLEQALATARASGRPALLYFATSWCGYCRLLERQTLPDPRVGAHLAAYTVVAYDAERGAGRDLAQRYGVVGFPTLVRVDASGRALGTYEGYDPPDAFVRRVPRP